MALMKKQIFEKIPAEDLLIVQVDMLKYENSFLKNALNILRKQLYDEKQLNKKHVKLLKEHSSQHKMAIDMHP